LFALVLDSLDHLYRTQAVRAAADPFAATFAATSLSLDEDSASGAAGSISYLDASAASAATSSASSSSSRDRGSSSLNGGNEGGRGGGAGRSSVSGESGFGMAGQPDATADHFRNQFDYLEVAQNKALLRYLPTASDFEPMIAFSAACEKRKVRPFWVFFSLFFFLALFCCTLWKN
jgi:hypothetical protein